MIDIHCHIIPGIDDGSPDLKTSVNMAKIALEDNITNIIATPHINEKTDFTDLRKRAAVLQKELDNRNIDVKIYIGGEIPFWLLDDEDKLITLAGSDFLLVEFPFDMVPKTALKKFQYLISKGYKIIIAHPERNIEIIRKPNILKKILIPGVFIQVTAMSLKGSFGRSIKLLSGSLLKKGMITFIASDSHESAYRIPEISFLLKNAKNKKENELLEKIIMKNPEMIFKND